MFGGTEFRCCCEDARGVFLSLFAPCKMYLIWISLVSFFSERLTEDTFMVPSPSFSHIICSKTLDQHGQRTFARTLAGDDSCHLARQSPAASARLPDHFDLVCLSPDLQLALEGTNSEHGGPDHLLRLGYFGGRDRLLCAPSDWTIARNLTSLQHFPNCDPFWSSWSHDRVGGFGVDLPASHGEPAGRAL